MSQIIEAEYDEFIKDIENKLQKIQPELAMQAMYYERKFTDVDPHGEIVIEYNEGIDVGKKRFAMGQKYGIEMAEKDDQKLEAVGLMTLATIYEISKDVDVKKITGTVSCASY